MLRKIFFINKIYSAPTVVGTAMKMLYIIVFGLMGLGMLAAASTSVPSMNVPAGNFLLLCMGVLLALLISRTMLIRFLLHQRLRQLAKMSLAIAHNPTALSYSRFLSSDVDAQLDNVDDQHLISQDTDYLLYDTTFNFYGHTKYGDYLSKQLFYTIFETQLARSTPHLIFDSKLAKGQQFRFKYLASQRLSLEGNFDQYFVTYAPLNYAIDTLSFITPDVMQAMLAARQFDMELIDNRLFLYGPLVNPDDMATMITLGRAIAAELNHNLKTYSDSYVAGAKKWSSTTPFARELLKSPLRPALTLSALVIGFGILTYGTHGEVLHSSISAYAGVFIASNAWLVFSRWRYNRRAEQTFHRNVAFDQKIEAQRRQLLK